MVKRSSYLLSHYAIQILEIIPVHKQIFEISCSQLWKAFVESLYVTKYFLNEKLIMVVIRLQPN